ncbi:MAG: alpha/beta hydrolase [Myxococcota bacterium]
MTLVWLSVISLSATSWETVEFQASDGLKVTADLYRRSDNKLTPFIVLFHQAGWSRGEYRDIAPRLNAMGFNCLAVDQRSGGEVNGVTNETALRAKSKGLSATYLDARKDMTAAIGYARKMYASGELLVWGSSYSAALVLHMIGVGDEKVDGVLSFSPGEYFVKLGKPRSYVAQAAQAIDRPVFLTSSKSEARSVATIAKRMQKDKTVQFVPDTSGHHGSRALWSNFKSSASYWKALKAFLDTHFPRSGR